MQKNEERGKDVVDRLVHRLTLQLYRIGCNERNFYLMSKLPLTAYEVERELKLSPMPTNRRINELIKSGLVSRKKAGEKIKLTYLGKSFISQINETKKDVISEMSQLI